MTAVAAEAVLLFPGAGRGRDHPTLVALERTLTVPVVRADFPYRREGRKAPDRPAKLIACVRDEAAALAGAHGVAPDRIVLGGRSMGGRMCSLAVAEGLPAAGLVLISYPLHPPGKPDRLRVHHFGDIGVPCLFVSGDRDPFGTPDELASWTPRIAGPVTRLTIEGGRHELAGADDRITQAVGAWMQEGAPPGAPVA